MKNIFVRPASTQIKPEGSASAALIAGLSLIVMALAAMFAFGFIHTQLVMPEDAAATAVNIATQPNLFQVEISLWIVIAIADIIVSLTLWLYFAGVNRRLSMITGLVRLVYTVSLILGIFNLLKASGSPDALRWIESFENIWSIGLIIFGLHLILLAWLTFMSGFVPAIWSWLLLIAGPSYMIINIPSNPGSVFNRIVVVLEMILVVPMTIAELGFAKWLIVRAVKTIKAATSSP